MHPIASEARASLANGHMRLVESTASLRDVWFPTSTEPAFGEQMLSDYGALHRDSSIAKEFEAEVSALIEAIVRHDDPRSLQEIDATEGSEAMHRAAEKRMNRRPAALAIWDVHGAPVRLRKDFVFRIVSPRDVMGDPIIRTYPAEKFVSEASVKIAELEFALRQAQRSITRWRISVAIFGIMLAVLVWRLAT
jgi:hypothetical protein